jgi:hypothetical protein
MDADVEFQRQGQGQSRIGCFVVLPILLCALLLALWFLIQGGSFDSPERAVERAHQKWDSNTTKLQIEAVKEYQYLLKKTDRLDPSRRWVRDDRDTLYRRVIVHEYKFQKNPDKAREYILDAWDEGIRDLRIEDSEVREFWDKVVEPLKVKDQIKDKNV